ncbi:AMIN domain-containing protein [Arcobacter sp. HD9-500m-PIT-SAG03]|nr:AMIN domain-containing protein [Arcobacter sp. HD9-500m-PIT-SAG03]
MKTISAFILLYIVVLSTLNARENPFEPTKTYETEFERLMEIEEDYPYEFQEKEDQLDHTKEVMQDKKEMVKPEPMSKKEEPTMATPVKKIHQPEIKKVMVTPEIMPEVKKEIKIPMKTETAKVITQNKVIQAKKEDKGRVSLDINKQEVLEDKKQKISLEHAMSELNKEKIEVDVPKRKDVVVQESIDILPFVNITYSNQKMEVSSKYEVFRKFTIDKSNKIVLDYHASIFFYTKKQISDTEYFEKVIVGNHKKEKYFRVVIVLKHKPSKYKVTYTDNLVTIEFDKNMI